MTREEAIEILKGTYDYTKDKSYNNYEVDIDRKLHKTIKKSEALDMAIKALEQEPCEDAIHRDRTVQDFVDKCRECGREKVLDKISTEIEQVKSIMSEEIIDNNRKDLINFVNGLNQSLMIIDKYKAESEDKE